MINYYFSQFIKKKKCSQEQSSNLFRVLCGAVRCPHISETLYVLETMRQDRPKFIQVKHTTK
jgi:hypothetical protein